MTERKKSNFTGITANSLLDLVKRGLKTKGFLYVTIGNLINAALGGLFYLLCARALSVTGYGHISYYISLGIFVGSISVLGLFATISTFYPKEQKEELVTESALLTFLIGIGLSVVASIYVFFFPPAMSSINVFNFQISIQPLSSNGMEFVFMVPIILGTVFYTISWARALGRRDYRRFFVIFSSVRILEIVLVGVFYFFTAFTGYFLKDVENLLLVAYAAPLFMVSYDYFRELISARRMTFHFSEIRAKLTFTLHTWGMNLAQASRSVLDKIVVGLFFGLLFLGTYNLAFQFLLIFLVIPQSLLKYLLPEKSSGSVRREIEIIGILATVLITIVGILIAPYFINWLFPSFTDSIPATQVISLAVLPATIASIKSSVLLSEERSKIVLIGYVTALAVDILGIILLGQIFQAVGFAAAFLISQVVLAILLLVLPSEKFTRLINREKTAVQIERKKS